MSDILTRVRNAFDSGSVPEKNIALRKAYDEIEKLQRVARLADKLGRVVAEFPDDPSIWAEPMDHLDTALLQAGYGTAPPKAA